MWTFVKQINIEYTLIPNKIIFIEEFFYQITQGTQRSFCYSAVLVPEISLNRPEHSADFSLFLACGHIDWNSHSVLGLQLFMFLHIILTFNFNAQRTCLILSILSISGWSHLLKIKRRKIFAFAHRLKITHVNSYFILMFLHTRIRDRNSWISSAIGCYLCVTFVTLMDNVADYFSW